MNDQDSSKVKFDVAAAAHRMTMENGKLRVQPIMLEDFYIYIWYQRIWIKIRRWLRHFRLTGNRA